MSYRPAEIKVKIVVFLAERKVRREETLRFRARERERLRHEGKPACANCKWVQVAEEGLYCWDCAEGMH